MAVVDGDRVVEPSALTAEPLNGKNLAVRRVESGWDGLGAVVRKLDGRNVALDVDVTERPDEPSLPRGAVQATGKLAGAVLDYEISLTVGDMAVLITRNRLRAFRKIYSTREPGGEPSLGWYEVCLEPGMVFFLREVRS